MTMSTRSINIIYIFSRMESVVDSQKIHGFWFKREIPTLLKVLITIKEDSDLPNLCRNGLYRLLADLNFEFTKKNRNSILTERADCLFKT